MKINPSPEAAASRAANVFAWKNETANELLRIQFLRTRKYFICKDDKGLVRLCKQKSGYIQSILKKKTQMASALCISRHFLKARQDPVNPQNISEYTAPNILTPCQ